MVIPHDLRKVSNSEMIKLFSVIIIGSDFVRKSEPSKNIAQRLDDLARGLLFQRDK